MLSIRVKQNLGKGAFIVHAGSSAVARGVGGKPMDNRLYQGIRFSARILFSPSVRQVHDVLVNNAGILENTAA